MSKLLRLPNHVEQSSPWKLATHWTQHRFLNLMTLSRLSHTVHRHKPMSSCDRSKVSSVPPKHDSWIAVARHWNC